MTSLKGPRGQTSLEMIIAASVLTGLLFGSIYLVSHGLATLIAKKWAAKTSQCFAETQNWQACQLESRYQLTAWFAFKEVHLRSWKQNETLHTGIKAKFLRIPVTANYDLVPSEYKRVSP